MRKAARGCHGEKEKGAAPIAAEYEREERSSGEKLKREERAAWVLKNQERLGEKSQKGLERKRGRPKEKRKE